MVTSPLVERRARVCAQRKAKLGAMFDATNFLCMMLMRVWISSTCTPIVLCRGKVVKSRLRFCYDMCCLISIATGISHCVGCVLVVLMVVVLVCARRLLAAALGLSWRCSATYGGTDACWALLSSEYFKD